MKRTAVSLQLRLVFQLLAIAALLAVVLYLTVRTVANQAAEATQDGVLGAATLAISERLQGGDDGVSVDLPYEAFSILGSISADRVFYRIDAGAATLTGYDDLPLPEVADIALRPVFYTRDYRGAEVRIAAVSRTVLVARKPVAVTVLVAQTRQGKEAIAQGVAQRAAALGLGFFALAALLSVLAAKSTLRPINRLAEAVERRGPQDLRFVDHPTPVELRPLISALNGFIARLRVGLSRTETFIAEAAHHIRTPLAVVRARAEIAMRQSPSEEAREEIRALIRAVEESSRTAGQLLAHATVVNRSDQLIEEPVDLTRLMRDLVATFQPTAELRDIALHLDLPEGEVTVRGDRPLLEAALRNLLDNAVKYSPEETLIEFRLICAGGHAEVIVADRGRGLSGQGQAQLAKRFVRGTNAGDVIGSGLGLTIVDEVATAHGGTFTLADREGGGTCARLSLPLS